MTDKVDVQASRSVRYYSTRENFGRIMWSLVLPLFRWSPRRAFIWRAMLLRLFGAKIGRRVHIYPTVRVYIPWNLQIGNDSCLAEWTLIYNLGTVKIGERVTVSHEVQICAGTHDYRRRDFPLVRSTVNVGDDSWICTRAWLGPNVNIGHRAVVAAAAVVTKNVPDDAIVGGNPARYLKSRRFLDDKNFY